MRRAAIAVAVALTAAVPASARHIPYGDPALPAHVSCGGDEAFPLAALQGPRFYERRQTLPAVALRRWIRRERAFGPQWPVRGFREVRRERRVALYAAGHPPRMVLIRMQRRRGRWDVTNFGDCLRLHPVDARGEAADWKLDPAAPPPAPESTEIPILVNENECASGEPATGRIEEPVLFADERRVVASIFVRPVEGGAECPGNPDTPYTLRLAEPLGDRALFAGGTVPARRRLPR